MKSSGLVCFKVLAVVLAASWAGQALGQSDGLPLGTHTKEYRLEQIHPDDPADGTSGNSQIPSAAVPEPSSALLLLTAGAGVAGFSLIRRRLRR